MKLVELVNITVGYPFRGAIHEVLGGTVHAIQMKDVSPEIGVNRESCVETELKGKRTPGWLKKGDILFAARGSRNYAVLIDEQASQGQIVASPHFYVLSYMAETVIPEYLVWFINQQPSQRYFQREAEGSYTKSIRRNVLEELPVAVPTIEKQKSIVRLAQTIKKEQQLMQQLTRNGEILMNAITNDLMKDGITK